MEWTEDIIRRLRELWDEGHSTAEIGRRLNISKNAVVGKAHRLDLKGRVNPIGKKDRPAWTEADLVLLRTFCANGLSRGKIASRLKRFESEIRCKTAELGIKPGTYSGKYGAIRQTLASAPRSAPRPATPSVTKPALAVVPSVVDPVMVVVKPVVRVETPPVQSSNVIPMRAVAATCCWPVGDPGTKSFRFCDDPVHDRKRPYCLAHLREAYQPNSEASPRDLARLAWRAG